MKVVATSPSKRRRATAPVLDPAASAIPTQLVSMCTTGPCFLQFLSGPVGLNGAGLAPGSFFTSIQPGYFVAPIACASPNRNPELTGTDGRCGCLYPRHARNTLLKSARASSAQGAPAEGERSADRVCS